MACDFQSSISMILPWEVLLSATREIPIAVFDTGGSPLDEPIW